MEELALNTIGASTSSVRLGLKSGTVRPHAALPYKSILKPAKRYFSVERAVSKVMAHFR